MTDETARPFSVHTARVTSWQIAVAMTASLAALVGLGQTGQGYGGWVLPWAVVLVVAIVLGLTGASMRTTAGPRGVSIRFGVLGWPRATYPMERIADARVVDVRPWSITGGPWWTPRESRFTLRSGPGLGLVLTSGRRVTITTNDPQAAVDALRAGLPAR